MLQKYLTILFCFLVSSILYAQNNLAIGQWEQYLPFNQSNAVTGGNDAVYYSTGTAIAVYHREDKSIEYWSKINRLSDVGISSLLYLSSKDVLIVGYDNGNLDLVFENQTVNMVDVLLNLTIQKNKSIQSIFATEDDRVFLSTAFGIIELSIDQQSFLSTIFTDSPVHQLTEFDGMLYAALDEGIFRVDHRSNANIIDFSSWQKLGPADGLPIDYSSKAISAYRKKLYADIDGDLMRIDQGMELIFSQRDLKVEYLYSGSLHIYAGFACQKPNGDACKGTVIAIDHEEIVVEAPFNCRDRPQYVYEDAYTTIWFADRFSILKKTGSLANSCSAETILSPPSNLVQNIKVIDDALYISTGGADDNMTYLQRQSGTYVYQDNNWIEYSAFKTPALSGVRDHYQILPHPDGSKIYISTIFSGLVEFDGTDFMIYNSTNSPLKRLIGDVGAERVFGIAFDKDLNLWMTNFGTANPLKILRSDGSWKSIKPQGSNFLSFIVIDPNGYKWISSETSGEGLIVFDEGDLDDPTDDRSRIINTSNSELQNNRVRSLAIDQDGSVWVGTDQGAVVFSCPDPFDASCDGNRPKVLQDGFLAFLLENERVNTIAVDPANRKWFGTDNGIFLQSPSGDEEILHFNTENSPLYSDKIIELEVDPKTGILYIGTDQGVMSFRSDAVQGKEFHSSELISFPNPVRPDYDGPIAIKGLANDSKVKITDVQGRIVFQTTSLGSQVIWDGRDFSGRRVQSGVYYIFGSTNAFFGQTDTVIGKLLFIGH